MSKVKRSRRDMVGGSQLFNYDGYMARSGVCAGVTKSWSPS